MFASYNILKRGKIRKGAAICAYSVFIKDVPEFFLIAGNSVRVIREL